MKCDKCGRQVNPWPLKRGSRCSPEDWFYCIRNDGKYRFSRPRDEDVEREGY